jgi:peptidoglycan hydrolase CwlO-like protein
MNNQLLRQMYSAAPSSASKNPNRVMGGLRAHGLNSHTVIAEDGSEHAVPSQRYVETLEEKVAELHATVKNLEKQLQKLNRTVNNQQNQINTVTRNFTQ